MNNAPAILRALIAYAICFPVAIWMGFLITNPLNYSTFGGVGLVLLVMSAPIFLRWHHQLLVLCWNLPLIMFFLPGAPTVYLPMIALSLGLSILKRTMDKNMRFISTPQLTLPLIFLAIVVLVTAKMRGGIGLHSLGSEVSGGKRYFFILGAIAGYFALKARRIPVRQAGLYVGMFFLGACGSVAGDLVSYLPPAFYFIYWFLPVNPYAFGSDADTSLARLGGTAAAALGIFSFMLAKYGLRGIFLSGKPLRIVFFCLFLVIGFLGGFRTLVATTAMIFMILFYLEKLHRTKMLPRLIFAGLIAAVICIPLANKLPWSVQRSFSFLPLNWDRIAVQDADVSAHWRWEMVKAMVPQVPQYLLLGKGYGLTAADFDAMAMSSGAISADQWGSAIATDFHNGPMSILIPLGIWGVIGFLWFLIAAGKALVCNYRYGDPALRTYNALLLAGFYTHAFGFFFLFGSLYSDMIFFAGYVGLSVSLNGGICRPVREPVQVPAKPRNVPAIPRPQLQPALRG
jgi:hypothetical protein